MSVSISHARCHLCGRQMRGGVCSFCDTAASADLSLRRRAWGTVSGVARRDRGIVVGLVVLLAVALLWSPWTSPAEIIPPKRGPAPGQTPEDAAAGSQPILAINVAISDWDIAQGRRGHAVVVRSTPASADLVTSFYVITERYFAGERMVTVADGARVLSGRVMSASVPTQTARIRVATQLPALPVAQEPPAFGDRVRVVGADGESVSGVVLPYDGAVGLLAFSAVVPASLAGAPVLDSRGEVIGIAQPSDEAAATEGVGTAVPISTACRAVGC